MVTILTVIWAPFQYNVVDAARVMGVEAGGGGRGSSPSGGGGLAREAYRGFPLLVNKSMIFR